MEAARQFSHGNLHPHWAFTPAFNAGEPRFVFYPPLSWYLGALLGLLLTHLPGITPAAGWTAAPILFTWIALTASGFTMHRLARSFTSENAALLAATLYLANPYLLFTAFERSAYGELLAAAWIPLLLHSILATESAFPAPRFPLPCSGSPTRPPPSWAATCWRCSPANSHVRRNLPAGCLTSRS